jgi:prefoldin subunit 5
VTAKAAEVQAVAGRIDELQAQKSALQAQLGTINSTLDDRKIARDVLVAELRALIAELEQGT